VALLGGGITMSTTTDQKASRRALLPHLLSRLIPLDAPHLDLDIRLTDAEIAEDLNYPHGTDGERDI
jgi:hypothetical protein